MTHVQAFLARSLYAPALIVAHTRLNRLSSCQERVPYRSQVVRVRHHLVEVGAPLAVARLVHVPARAHLSARPATASVAP